MANEVNKEVRLDLGCGKNKKDSTFIGVDSLSLPGVDIVVNLAEREKPKKGETQAKFKKWPWDDNSVDEVHCSHFVEHLTNEERVHFCNEVYRILKPGCKATVIAPHCFSNRSYGDPTHVWPPVSEMWFYYLSAAWRKDQAPHTDAEVTGNDFLYKCDFSCGWGYSFHPSLTSRNQEYQNFAINNFKEAAQDIISTWTKVVPQPTNNKV